MPFDDTSIRELIRQQAEKLKFPRGSTISKECRTIIRDILNVDPKKRLKMDQIRESDWMQRNLTLPGGEDAEDVQVNPLPTGADKENVNNLDEGDTTEEDDTERRALAAELLATGPVTDKATAGRTSTQPTADAGARSRTAGRRTGDQWPNHAG